MPCPRCNYENPAGVRFCANCGSALGDESPAPQPTPQQPAPYPQPPTPYPPTVSPNKMMPPTPSASTYRPLKDRSVAYILEILPGLFGIMGIGWLYSGNTGAGIAWLVGVLMWDFFAIIIDIVTVGFGCFCSVPVNIILIAVSTILLSSYVKGHPELFG